MNDNLILEINNFISKFDDCIAQIENSSIWSGASKDNFFNSLSEFNTKYSDKVLQQLGLLSSAIELYNKYSEKCKKIDSLNISLNDSSLDEESISNVKDEISSLNLEKDDLKTEIKEKLENIIKLDSDDSGYKEGFTNYYQTDYSNSYGGSTISRAGCGPTSMAMVLTYLTGEEITPVEAATWSEENNYVGGGTYFGYFSAIADDYGLDYSQCTNKSEITTDNIVGHLENGELIIMHMGPGHFTSGGHYIVLTGITDDGKVIVADPYSREKSAQTWDPSIFVSETKGNMICFET